MNSNLLNFVRCYSIRWKNSLGAAAGNEGARTLLAAISSSSTYTDTNIFKDGFHRECMLIFFDAIPKYDTICSLSDAITFEKTVKLIQLATLACLRFRWVAIGRFIWVNFKKLTNSNQIFWNYFVCIHYQLYKMSAENIMQFFSSFWIIIIIKKSQQCKAGREWYTQYQSEDPSPTIPTYRQKEEKGKESRRL